jgi:hypothetical protein
MFNCPTCGKKEGIYFHATRRYVSTPNGMEIKVVGDPHISCLLCKIKGSVDKLSKTKEFGKATA